MRLSENYKKCWCGAKLNKRNRFAVKLEAPENINTLIREKNKQPDIEKTIVNYCCEECYHRLYDSIPKILGTEDWFIYYENSFKV